MRLPGVRWALSAPIYMTASTLGSTALLAALLPEGASRLWIPTVLGLVVGIVCLAFGPRIPTGLVNWLRGHKRLTALAVVLATLAFIQTARQSAFIADSEFRWGRALPTVTTDHQCVAAYIRAAEIDRDDLAGIYEDASYRQMTTLRSTISGLTEHLGDPFVYPPQALLLPRIGIALSDRFSVLQAAWWGIAGLLFGGVAFLLARHLEGDREWVVWLLIPGVWISLPVVHNMEYGQVHLLTLASSMAAMLAFHHKRDALGGGLLAMAIGWKLFPAVLLLYLIAQRRRRAVLSTILCSAALLILGLAVSGWGAYDEFVFSHLPRLVSGEAFERYFAWDDVTAQFSLAGNARVLGVGSGLGRGIGALYTIGAVGLAVFVGRRDQVGSPLVWLSILNLAAMQSPFAPASYVAAGIVWLLSFWVAEHWNRMHLVVAGIAIWFFVQTAPFFSGIPGLWGRSSLHNPAAFIATLLAVAVCVHGCLFKRYETSVKS